MNTEIDWANGQMITRIRALNVSRQMALTMAMFFAVSIDFGIYVYAEKQIDRANDQRQLSYQLAAQLRQSSDDLTRMAQIYVVSGNPIYKQYFQDILDIRDGKKRQPEGYLFGYWDLVLANPQLPRSDNGQAIALLDLMRQAGYTDEEFAKLAEGKANSDALTKLEFEAMRLAESVGPDAPAKRAQASLMLHDENYHRVKAAIMKPISEADHLVDMRTLSAVRTAEQFALIFRLIFITVTLVAIYLLWRAYKNLQVTLGGSADQVHAEIVRIGRGDFSTAIAVNPGMENSVLKGLAEMQDKLNDFQVERKQAEEALRVSAGRLNAAQHIANLGSWSYDLTTGRFEWSDELYKVYGVLPETFTPNIETLIQLIHPDDRTAMQAWIGSCASGRKSGPLEFRCVRPDGTIRYIESQGELALDAQGKPVQMSGTAQDITSRKNTEQRITYLAFYDSLTQLANRQLLMDRLQQALASSTRSERNGALFLLDLDDFKTLNDTLGHDKGDMLLQQVAQRLAACVREGDTVARLGGDEFVVLLEGLSELLEEAATQAEILGEKILATLNQPYQLAGYEKYSTASLGVTAV